MSNWQSKPPTYDQWHRAKNHGVWWVKFLLYQECGFEEWYTDVVHITVSFDEGKMLNADAAHLRAHGHIIGIFELDDEEQTRNMYWQPAKPPLDECSGRPNI